MADAFVEDSTPVMAFNYTNRYLWPTPWEIDSTPAMAFNDTNYNAPLPLSDPPDNYGENFYPPLAQPTFSSNNSYLAAVIAVIMIFMLVFSVILRCRQHQQYFLSGRTSPSRQPRFSFAPEDPLSLCNMGLDARVVEALPVFEYKAQSFNDALDCAVCLSEFEENQKARFLPNCKHSFHVDCIDMWFHSHSTCPICRTGVHPKNSVIENSVLVRDSHKGKQVAMKQKPQNESTSTSGINSMPENAIDMLGRSENFSSEKQACLPSGSHCQKPRSKHNVTEV